MMKYFDFKCSECDYIFEDLVDSNTTELLCPVCEDDDLESRAYKIMSSPRIMTSADPAVKAEMLRKRSHDHSVKEARKNAEHIASKLGGVAKPQAPWNLRKKKQK